MIIIALNAANQGPRDHPERRSTVVHAQHDGITSHCYAAQLAADHGGELLIVPNATHSWPYADVDRFADTVQRLLP